MSSHRADPTGVPPALLGPEVAMAQLSPKMRKRQLADSAHVRTVQLSLDGETYCVTLSRAEQRRLRLALRPFVDVARPVPAPQGPETETITARLRDARVQALLGLAPHAPRLSSS